MLTMCLICAYGVFDVLTVCRCADGVFEVC